MGVRVVAALPHTFAQIVKGALEAEGIRVRLERDALSGIYGLDTGTFATRLYVADEDFEAARDLIEEIEQAR